MSESTSLKTGNFEKKGVVEVGLTPSEQSCKTSEKIEKGQALTAQEQPAEDLIKKASELF